MRRCFVLGGAVAATWLLGSAVLSQAPDSDAEVGADASAFSVLGAPRVKNAYHAWAKAHEAAGGDANVRIPLGYNKALSRSFSSAHGVARLDLVSGRVEIAVSNLPEGDFDAWIIDNRPGEGASAAPDESDLSVRLGRLTREGADAHLSQDVGDMFQRLQADLVAIAPADRGPEAGLVYGSTDLFQRLYTALRSPELLALSDYALPQGRESIPSPFGISIAQAQEIAVVDGLAVDEGEVAAGFHGGSLPAPSGGEILVDEDVLFDALVARGADLFINETFDGNGRTCATCHPVGDNTQLSVSDIAALPDNDPLFAAEFIPSLGFTPNGEKFEVPLLMRSLALIVENVDGLDERVNKFTMRSIPHTLGLTTSITPNLNDGTATPGPNNPNPPAQRTGWGGDGAPTPGSLRDFAMGAVVQHFPLTLARQAGADFRLPTEPELDAMLAFQLSLGRQSDLTLPLSLIDPIVSQGQAVFMSDAARCNTCHNNASANIGNRTNRNFNTGVEDQVDRPIQVVLASFGLDLTPDLPGLFPRDGGFGVAPDGLGGFGNGTFNTPPLVESADTAPFFHDNQIRTIEGAVAFYNGTSFANSPVGNPPIDLQPTQVEQVAAFLRAINALENLRASRELVVAIAGLSAADRIHKGRPLLLQAAEEIDDAISVLAGADLHPNAVADLREARSRIPSHPSNAMLHPSNLNAIRTLLDQARSDIVL